MWTLLLAAGGLACLLLFQACAYFERLPLSLGPRVILEPWLMQRGLALYEDIADVHGPLMPLSIAWLRPLVPDGLLLAKLVLVALVSLSTLLTFLAARRVAGWLGGLWSASLFVLWSPSLGFGKLWYESFLAPLYALLLWRYDPLLLRRSPKSLLSLGVIAGCALLVKQHSVLVVLSVFVWTAVANRQARRSALDSLRDSALMGAGIMVPVLAFGVYQYVKAGTVSGCLWWIIGYALASDYASLAAQWPTLREVRVVVGWCLLLFIAPFSLLDCKRKGDETWLRLGWGLSLFAASCFTVYPRFGLFHLQAALPAMAWLSSLVLARAWRAGEASRPLVAGMAVGLSVYWLIWRGGDYRPVFAGERAEKIEQYSELKPLAKDLCRYVAPADSVYVFPDDEVTANLYYVMGRVPPGFWQFHYPWYMSDQLKRGILAVLRERPAEWVVYLPGRWEVEEYGAEILAYIQTRYRQRVELNWAHGSVLLLERVE